MAYTFSLSRRSIPVRCLCLLLVVLVLWCFFMVPRAGAVATEAATVAYAGALIGTILVGAGVVFSSHGDMQAVGAAMYKSWIKSSNAIGSTISAIASWALEHGEAVAKGALRVGKDMYQAVVDAFNASYSDGRFTIANPDPGDIYVSTPFSDTMKANICSFFDAKPSDFYVSYQDGRESQSIHYKAIISGDRAYFYYCYPDGTSKIHGSYPLDSSYRYQSVYFDWYIVNTDGFYFKLYADFYDHDGVQQVISLSEEIHHWRSFYLSTSNFYFKSDSAISVPPPDLAYPSDNTLVRMPDIPSVDTATGTVTFPSDAAYTKDAVAVPYPVDTEGVKVPDIPYDKVVDQSTGKTLDDADTGTDTKPGEGSGTEIGSGVSGLIGTIIGLLKNFFDSPSDFKLDMDGFRNLAIADKFPFCIPFDMVDSVKQFAATAADYQFRIKFDTQYFSVDHTVDLTPIAVPLAFFRYIVCVWFVWVLMSRTHDLMKW